MSGPRGESKVKKRAGTRKEQGQEKRENHRFLRAANEDRISSHNRI
jgi:hypothetical protein